MARPRVGLALSAGSARGVAHIGVLQVFEENQIPIDIITGTSAGAIVAGLYASGSDIGMIGKLACEMNWGQLVNFTVARRGLVSSEPIYELLRLLTRDQVFADLSIPTAVIATDIRTGEEVVIRSGLVADGIRASLSIPGIFVPVELDGRMLVDGALVNRVPATVCRQLGADLVIAVDVGFPPLGRKVKNMANVIMRTIEILDRENAKFRPIDGDVILRPDLGNISSTQLNRAKQAIEAGRECALAHIDEIKAKLH